MDNNKISNPKTEVPTGMKLNDKDYMDSTLSTLKAMEKDFTVALTEVSNEVLFGKYEEMFNEIKSFQREVYELMFKNGWYELEKAETTKINEKYNKLQKEFTELNG